MKILQLCKKFPYPLKDGESIAVTSLGKSLHQLGCQMSLLAMNTKKHYFHLQELPSEADHYQEIAAVEVDNSLKFSEAFLNLFSKDSYHISRFWSPSFAARLKRMLQQQSYDVVQLETLYLAPYIPIIRQHSDAIIAMRAHNVEHEIWKRIADNTRFWPKKWYLQHLTEKLRQFEQQQLQQYDLLIAITERDERIFKKMGYRNESVVVPIGLDSDEYLTDYSSYQRKPSIGFIGSLDWMPNQEGLIWFLEKVWPDLQRKHPDLQFHIAGRNTPEWLQRLRRKHVTVHGEVPNAADFINNHSIMVVPLLSGSGMRAKIVEGMMLGRVVVTTAVGLEGIDARNGEEVIIANEPAEFKTSIDRCLKNWRRLEHIGRKGQEFAVHHYDSLEIARHLLKAYASLTVEAL
ncbi:MAG TPA: glycosyltransferase family 4 protein [Saprospiraceae bacterium]|nr:glycosyltransferase family 4 protein [Saprospiraceae bacterium]HMQ83353.1 glycosyltransferase family 4 protein [Saprospiraceae bacterium]